MARAAGTVVVRPGAAGLALTWLVTAPALVVFMGVGIERHALKTVLEFDGFYGVKCSFIP